LDLIRFTTPHPELVATRTANTMAINTGMTILV
jgi:hypothetical protein